MHQHLFIRPFQYLKAAVMSFHQRGTGLDPIAVIAIQHTAVHGDLRVVDVAADHTMDIAFQGLTGHGLLVVADKLGGILDLVFDVCSQ